MSLPNNIQSAITQPIFFIGFMGCGKTTLGKKIAKRSGVPFIDLDQRIIEETKMSIAEYFTIHGEDAFRSLESRLLKSLPIEQANIVSTGGGAPCFYDNMDWMNANGITVYLKLSPKMLLHRLSGKGGTSRPLLQGKSDEEMLDFITIKLSEREKYYGDAKLIIDAHTMNPAHILDLITSKE